MSDIRILRNLFKSKHDHFLIVDFKFYKRWKLVIKILLSLNKEYISCEIFRKKYKFHKDFVVVGLKWGGRNVKRRTSGIAKEHLQNSEGSKCIYCDIHLTNDNATSDHIIPISKKGNNCQVNLVICCKDCNGERGNMNFSQYLKKKNPKYLNIKYPFV